MEKGLTLVYQGAEARLYEGMFHGRKCIVKERFTKTYRHPDLDERLTKDRMRGELRGLLRAKSIGIKTPAVYMVNPTNNSIVMELVEGVDTVNVHIGKVLQQQGDGEATSTENLKQLAASMGVIIGKIHAAGIIHGDLTTSNILVEPQPEDSSKHRSLTLIDFGLSHVDISAEDKAVDLYVLERALTSTFSTIPWFFEALLCAYSQTYVSGGGEVVQKLDEVRLRGRKRLMLG